MEWTCGLAWKRHSSQDAQGCDWQEHYPIVVYRGLEFIFFPSRAGGPVEGSTVLLIGLCQLLATNGWPLTPKKASGPSGERKRVRPHETDSFSSSSDLLRLACFLAGTLAKGRLDSRNTLPSRSVTGLHLNCSGSATNYITFASVTILYSGNILLLTISPPATTPLPPVSTSPLHLLLVCVWFLPSPFG